MPDDDLNLHIARAKGWTRLGECSDEYGKPLGSIPTSDGCFHIIPIYDSDPAASAGLVDELCKRGPLRMEWDGATWTIGNLLEGDWEMAHGKTQEEAVARFWLVIFEGAAHA